MVFVFMCNGLVIGDWEIFVDNIVVEMIIEKFKDVKYCFMGLVVGLDGSFYIIDFVEGKVWKVCYFG